MGRCSLLCRYSRLCEWSVVLSLSTLLKVGFISAECQQNKSSSCLQHACRQKDVKVGWTSPSLVIFFLSGVAYSWFWFWICLLSVTTMGTKSSLIKETPLPCCAVGSMSSRLAGVLLVVSPRDVWLFCTVLHVARLSPAQQGKWNWGGFSPSAQLHIGTLVSRCTLCCLKTLILISVEDNFYFIKKFAWCLLSLPSKVSSEKLMWGLSQLWTLRDRNRDASLSRKTCKAKLLTFFFFFINT